MIHSLLSLPYALYWLPAGSALCLSFVIYLVALRPGRPSGPVEAPGEPEAEKESDPFTGGSTGEQRVAFRRAGNPVEVLYAEDEHHVPHRGYVVDRSVGGLRLMATTDVPPGTILAVRPVHVSAMVPWVKVEVRSTKSSALKPGEFDLGCQFIKSPPYPILLLFG